MFRSVRDGAKERSAKVWGVTFDSALPITHTRVLTVEILEFARTRRLQRVGNARTPVTPFSCERSSDPAASEARTVSRDCVKVKVKRSRVAVARPTGRREWRDLYRVYELYRNVRRYRSSPYTHATLFNERRVRAHNSTLFLECRSADHRFPPSEVNPARSGTRRRWRALDNCETYLPSERSRSAPISSVLTLARLDRVSRYAVSPLPVLIGARDSPSREKGRETGRPYATIERRLRRQLRLFDRFRFSISIHWNRFNTLSIISITSVSSSAFSILIT